MDDYAPLEGLKRLGPWEAIPISAADGQMAVLAQRVADSGDEIALVDGEDKIIAVLMSLPRLEDLEDDLAIARSELAKAEGTQGTPHEQFVAELEAEE